VERPEGCGAWAGCVNKGNLVEIEFHRRLVYTWMCQASKFCQQGFDIPTSLVLPSAQIPLLGKGCGLCPPAAGNSSSSFGRAHEIRKLNYDTLHCNLACGPNWTWKATFSIGKYGMEVGTCGGIGWM